MMWLVVNNALGGGMFPLIADGRGSAIKPQKRNTVKCVIQWSPIMVKPPLYFYAWKGSNQGVVISGWSVPISQSSLPH